MKQSEEFLKGEGKAWLARNIDKLTGENDPVLEAIEKYKLELKDVLEVGCANGWRVDIMEKMYGAHCVLGLDPGGIGKIMRGTAAHLPIAEGTVNGLIYGWCLYLCDPEDYFQIAKEGDRVLRDGGYLIVYDFNADSPFKTKYKHREGLWSYHFDFANLWLSSPAYSVYGRTVQDETRVTILKKNTNCWDEK